MTRTVINSIRSISLSGAALRTADRADPIPPNSLTATADLAIRSALALMPFSAIVWLFVAR